MKRPMQPEKARGQAMVRRKNVSKEQHLDIWASPCCPPLLPGPGLAHECPGCMLGIQVTALPPFPSLSHRASLMLWVEFVRAIKPGN